MKTEYEKWQDELADGEHSPAGAWICLASAVLVVAGIALAVKVWVWG